jgi:RNA ligase
MDTTFPRVISACDAIRRECRGLVFDKNGWILARRFHKFFNLNEREETLARNVDFSKPHSVLAKIDGSMISPVIINGEIIRCDGGRI